MIELYGCVFNCDVRRDWLSCPQKGVGAMVVRGSTFGLALCLLVWGFAQGRQAQIFFESKQSYRQVIPLMNETEVVLESSMPESKVVVQRGIDRQVTLDITGRFVIAGYHGSREAAGVHDIAGPDLAFAVSRTSDTLTLSSPEWNYIHHSLLVDHLTINLPESLALRVRRLSTKATGDPLMIARPDALVQMR